MKALSLVLSCLGAAVCSFGAAGPSSRDVMRPARVGVCDFPSAAEWKGGKTEFSVFF